MEGPVTLKLAVIATFLIVLSDVIGPGVYGCPSACLCYVDEDGLRTANCTGVTFISENKYNKVFHEIGVLNIQTYNDEPIRLWDDMFISFTKLKFLNLQNCRISYLPKNVFKGLKKVYEINLSSNDIKHFDNAVFENIYALNKLNLRGNRLQGSNKPFITSCSLKELDLGYCGIISLQNELFHGVKKLARLYLDGNHLQTVKEHILPSRITHLSLANNRIINVPISTISSLNQLRWLDLGANPINCTCSLLNLQDILSGHATIIEGDLICAYPPELENISLSKVNENEVCNKETFSSRYHFKKSQTTKYTPYPKKDYYFDNEKFNPFEIQGDDPNTSTDDYPDVNDETNKPVDTKVNEETKDEKDVLGDETGESINHKTPENLVQGNDSVTVDTNKKDNTENDTDTQTSHDNIDSDIDKEKEDTELEKNENDTLHNEESVQDSTPKQDDNETNSNVDIHDEESVDNKSTESPLTTDEDVVIPPDVQDKSSDFLDENMKNDEVMPVSKVPSDEHIENTDHIEANASSVEKDDEATNVVNQHTEKNDKVEQEVVIGVSNTDNDTKQDEKSGKNLVEFEGSGTGPEEMTTANSSIPLIHEDDVIEHFLPDIKEDPIHKEEVSPVEGHDNEKSTTDEAESVGQVVDKQPINYEEMGPIIVIACIIVFITILVFVALYKGLCKSKEINRKPVSDVEANNGTELQDITSSLLPKSPINDEKHNNKYPNEVPSPETVNLIKADKTEDINEPNHTHDLNQNDNKNNTIVKNGKTLEGSPPPIEKTKAKLTELPDSIPKMPIFFERSLTTNNG